MKNVKAVMGVLLVFILGAASGAVITHMIDRARHESFVKGGGAAREEEIVSRLTRKLDLDPQQQVQIRGIVHENHLAMRQVRKQCQPQIQAIVDQGQTRIFTLLNPEQQKKFQQIIQERQRHHPPEVP